jgi:beta-galactosidase
MKKILLTGFFIVLLFSVSVAQRTIISFDANWKFLKKDVQEASQENFNDALWRALNVPHDWSVEGKYDRANSSGRGGGFVETGMGWYRKTFTVNEATLQSKVFIEFDGVMMNSDVYINGHHLGKRPYGYSSFQYELTPYLHPEKKAINVIAVRVDNSLQPASRWYTGSGIYRHVRLIVTNHIHIAHWGTFVTTPLITGDKATVQIKTAISNQSSATENISLQTKIIDAENKEVAFNTTDQKITLSSIQTAEQKLIITNPKLWSVDKPQQYTAITKLFKGKQLLDEVQTKFGIRSIQFNAATGFWLNDKNIKLKGVCLHHDGGAVGAAVPLAVWQKRLLMLKAIGVNAIRTSHNPPSPELLDLCDAIGFLVMDETFDTWNAKKSSADYGYNKYFNEWWENDTRDMILRDRNHPSIVIYSVGNEIHDNLNDTSGFRKYKMQQDFVHSLDTTRPVTMALFRPALSHVYENDFANKMDVVGQNYRENELIAAHEKNPSWKVIGTENTHVISQWLALRDKPYMSGQFLWTGFDYLGEADWPAIANGQGLFDRANGKKDVAYQRESWWSDKPMVYVMRKQGNAGAGEWVSDWSPTDIDTYDEARIQVFSNCEEVELFLNGKSQGAKPRTPDNASPRTWQVTFEKGTLKAIAKNSGKIVAEQELTTAGVPSKIILTADKPVIANNWDDVVYVTATITDENNIPCLATDSQLTFTASGAGIIAATDNGDVTSTESFLSPKRFVYKGRCIALIKANSIGIISITASADKLKPATIVLQSNN